MNEMVEHVAKTMRRRQFERTGGLESFDEQLEPTENELDNARAVIEAVRTAWRAMIDVALK